MFSRLLVVLTLAIMALVPVAAEARNRTTEMLISDLAISAGVSYQTALDRTETLEGEDSQIIPGIYVSTGGFSYAYGGDARTLIAIRIFNENNFAICVRMNAALLGGPMVGTQQGGSLGYNVLLEPGSSETVIAHTARARHAVTSAAYYTSYYYFWLAAPAGTEGRCSSVAPADVDRIGTDPLPPAQKSRSLSTPELYRALEMGPKQSGLSSAPPIGANPSYSSVPAERRTAEWILKLVNITRGYPGGNLENPWQEMTRLGSWSKFGGPFQASLSVVRYGDGTYGATDRFFNDYGGPVCLYIAGDYDVGLVNPTISTRPNSPERS